MQKSRNDLESSAVKPDGSFWLAAQHFPRDKFPLNSATVCMCPHSIIWHMPAEDSLVSCHVAHMVLY